MRVMVQPFPSKYPDYWVPKLYAVIVSKDATDADINDMRDWCNKNCREAFYFFNTFSRKIGVQFEDDEDALMFALRWS